MAAPAKKDLIASKGRIWVFDEILKKMVEIATVDNARFNAAANPVEVKTPSGITIYKNIDLDAAISFDWYHPANNKAIELLFRGAVELTETSGSTLISGEKQNIMFRNAAEAAILAGFNGAKTAVTITNIKSLDGTVTYTVTDDYTVAVDTATGMTMIVHVSDGAIPLNEEVVVTYSYTPLAAQILKPVAGSSLIDRYVVIDSYPDCNDLTKYRRYFLPRAMITTELMHSMLEIGEDNNRPNILPVTLEYQKPDACDHQPEWYWIDTNNAPQ